MPKASKPPEVSIEVLPGRGLTRRIKLVVGGETLSLDRVGLDSAISKKRTVNKWVGLSKKVDAESVAAALELEAVRAQDEMASPRENDDLPRLWDFVDQWFSTLEPEWHREHKAIYFKGEHIGREVKVHSLWALASQELVDAVAETEEGREIRHPTTQADADYNRRLSLLKNVIVQVAHVRMQTLPEVGDLESDPTIDAEALRSRLACLLMERRSYVQDNTVPFYTTIWDWVRGLEPSPSWVKFPSMEVYARAEQVSNPCLALKIAVNSAALSVLLRYPSPRQMIAAFRGAKIIGDSVTEARRHRSNKNGLKASTKLIKVTRVVIRVTTLSPEFISYMFEQAPSVTHCGVTKRPSDTYKKIVNDHEYKD